MSAAMHGQDSRVIHYAMLASIVLHALLLSFSTKETSRRAAAVPAPIVARLVEQQPVAPAQPGPVAPPRVEQPKAPVVKPPTPKPRPLAKAAPKAPPAQPAPPALPTPPVAATPAAPAVEPQASAPAPSAAPAPAPVSPVAPSPSPSAGDFDAGALARYRILIAGEAGKLKRYPRAAIDNNWAGRVVVAVTVRANGVPSYSVRISSGHTVLDQQALEMISKAQARTEVPASLRGREFRFEIPVDFDLKDASS
jgi:periplasmic protein TonB